MILETSVRSSECSTVFKNSQGLAPALDMMNLLSKKFGKKKKKKKIHVQIL
jgi:hypothetical protein